MSSARISKGTGFVQTRLSDGVLILVFCAKEVCGVVVVKRIDHDAGARAEIRALKGALLAEIPASSFLEAKLVGPAGMVSRLKTACSEFGISIRSEFETDAGNQKIFCQPGNGRVLIEQAATAKPAPSAPTPVPVSPVATRKTKVLIVDDSKTMLKVLTKILSKDPNIEVIGTVQDPLDLEHVLKEKKPDVMTLDMYMPHLDGCQVLERFLPIYKIPTLLITSISRREAPEILRALELGAIDYIPKPGMDQMQAAGDLIIEKVLSVSGAKINLSNRKPRRIRTQACNPEVLKSTLIAFGSSTGGTEALKEVLLGLPAEIPPILCVQHIPPVFSAAFAERLNQLCPFEVREAKDLDEVREGLVLIAPGGFHMALEPHRGSSTGFRVRILDQEPVNRHKPSVDVLFDSVASHLGGSAIGVILTGMGADGAKGMLNMHKAGARTIAQDEKTCAVFGMPREAIRLGGVTEIRPLDGISEKIEEWLNETPCLSQANQIKF